MKTCVRCNKKKGFTAFKTNARICYKCRINKDSETQARRRKEESAKKTIVKPNYREAGSLTEFERDRNIKSIFIM